MSLVLNEEQTLLKETAVSFFNETAPVSQLRALRDSADSLGYAPALWQSMAETGFTAILVPEEYGGAGFGVVGACSVAEAMGQTLAASPYLASAVFAASLLASAPEEVQAKWLPSIADGSCIATVALDEGNHHKPSAINTTAKAGGGSGFTLSGLKLFVPDGHVADVVFVVAKDADGALGLYAVKKGAKGLIADQVTMADSRNWAKLTFEGVEAEYVCPISDGGAGADLTHALDVTRTVLAAEMLGIAASAFERTMGYLKERKQFGTTIGAFQALQHRAAHMFSVIEVARSAIMKAASEADQPASEREKPFAHFASLAKAKACEMVELVTNEAIQMHGGIGMTDEYDLGFYIKRARAVEQYLGDYAFHADRFARLSGF